MENGADLETIQTEVLGFRAIEGDAKVQLTSQWSPAPAATASLLSIASRKGLVAAASPDGIYVASTESVRKAFQGEKSGDSEARPFEPQAKIPMPMRISHLAFTADEQYLIMSAEQGGGLALYETQTLLQGSSQSAFEISTSGESVRALIPNPMPELAEQCAVVTNNGNLLMANINQKALVTGPNGAVIRPQVACAAWSTKGKQLVAGMADGTVVQMKPDGTETGHIPKPDTIGDFHVASIAWLENHLFLVVYNENTGSPPNSEYRIVSRSQSQGQAPSFQFRKLTDPVMPFGNERAPQHMILRLRDYPPKIQDILIVASTATDAIGLLTRSKAPLTNDLPAEAITEVFTTTEFADDSKRAQLPSGEDYIDTFPIGLSLDLSSKDNVYKPIPSDEEIEQSPGPLPALWALNNDGVLSAWWVIYNDAIRENKTYPGMIAAQGELAARPAVPASTTSTFGSQTTSSPIGGSSGFGKFGNTAPALNPKASPFGAPAATSGPAFGKPSFGTSSFGSQTAAPAFGQSGGLGARSSPWVKGSTGATAPAFGSHGFSSPAAPAGGGSTSGKVFGSGAASAIPSTVGGFAGFASKGGFTSLSSNASGESVLSKPSAPSSFGGATSMQSVFGKPSGTGAFGSQEASVGKDTAFPLPSSTAKDGPSFGSSPFVLGTTFKADPASANDNEKPSGKGGFGLGGFGLSLDDAASKPTDSYSASKDEDMDTSTAPLEQEKPKSVFDQPQESTTPTSTPAPSKFFSADTSKPNPFSAQPSTSSPFGSPFGKPSPFAPTNSVDKPKPSPSPFGSLLGNTARANPFTPKDVAEKPRIPEVAGDGPLPPESTSKAAYSWGDSPASSTASAKTPEDFKKATAKSVGRVDDAPLPPDFLKPQEKSKTNEESMPPPLPKEESPVQEEAPLPPDFVTKPKTESKSPLFGFKQPTSTKFPESHDEDLSEGEVRSEGGSEGQAAQSGGEEEEEEEEEEEYEEEEEEEEEEEGDEGDEGGSEGSGVDVAKDLSPGLTGAGHTPGITPQSSFGGMAGSNFSLVSRPDVAQPPRPPLFGEISQNAPVFPKPAVTSPRSPSPIRSTVPSRIFPADGSRSVSAPGMASQILGASQSQGSGHSKTISTRLQPQEDPNVALQREAQKKQAEHEQASLEDEEFEVVQRMLKTEVEPSVDIGEFNAFNSLTADAHASTVAAQVEALYRDINGMLVTLGLNARALASFIKGHELRKGEAKTKDYLGNPDEWVMCEAEDLGHILDGELATELEEGRLQDLDDTWDTCQGLARGIPKLRAKQQDLKSVLGAVLDPDEAAAARTLPLSAEQSAQQNELRQKYAAMTRLMADAESALTMLKTKVATVAGAAGKTAAVPTVDAVMRTIMKMTSAAEKRSGDLDVLESQMRKLRLGTPGASTGPLSREGSPAAFATPQSKRHSFISAGTHTPSPRKSLTSSLNGSISASGRTVRATPRKNISGFTEEDKDTIRTRMQKRQAVLNQLRRKLEENGPKVRDVKLTDGR